MTKPFYASLDVIIGKNIIKNMPCLIIVQYYIVCKSIFIHYIVYI